MNNKECMIIRDLIPNYIENLLSNDSKEFVDEHIKTCSECKEILEDLKDEQTANIKKETEEEQIEYKHLKKYKNKMSILKVLLITILIVVITACILIFLNYFYIDNIIRKSADKINEIGISNNFSFFTQEHSTNYSGENISENIYENSFYYLNGNYMKKSSTPLYDNNINPEYYGKISSNTRTIVEHHNKQIITETANYPFEKMNLVLNSFYWRLLNYNKLKGFSRFYINWSLKIKEDRFNGKDCYVLIHFGANGGDVCTIEIYIDKETMLPIRFVEDAVGKQYTEKIIVFKEGEVTDNDVAIPQYKDYEITEEQIEGNDMLVWFHNR